MTSNVATAERAAGKDFASAAEMRSVLEGLLDAVQRDPELGPRIASLHVSYRYVFDDVDLTLDIAGSEGDGTFNWTFDGDEKAEPSVTLQMSSEVANRYLQGHENLAIALARRRIRYQGSSRAALAVLPINRELGDFYREVLEDGHRHLLLD